MSHQPFETWLLSEEPLSTEQAQALRDHLRECPACQQVDASWAGTRQLFRAAPPAAPAPGFTARWQARQAEQQAQRYRRQTMALLGFTAGSAAVFFTALVVRWFLVMRSPGALLSDLSFRLTALLVFADSTSSVIAALWRGLLLSVPLPVWVLVPGSISFLIVLWLVAFQQLTSARRVQL